MKVVASAALVDAAAETVEQELVALITKHAGGTAGSLAGLVGAGIIQVVENVVKPNSADAAGEQVAITS